jgi:hypothetical protein
MESKNIMAETGIDLKSSQHKNIKIFISKELKPIHVATV